LKGSLQNLSKDSFMCNLKVQSQALPECSKGSKMTKQSEQITVYGASWCPDARRARRVFDEQGVKYNWIDIDADNDGREFVKKTNNGQVVIPVIVFPDESVLVEPSNYQLESKIEAILGRSGSEGLEAN
jgi:mycoredoxin